MKIGVLLELPAERHLVEPIIAERSGVPKSIAPDFKAPEHFELDYHFSPEPVGESDAIIANLDSTEAIGPAALHQNLIVRGDIEVQSLDSIPTQIAGHRVLADPVVDTYSTCFDDSAVGTADELKTALQVDALHANGLDGEGTAIAIIDRGLNLDFLEQKLGFRPELDLQLSWRPRDIEVEPGEFRVGHGTMCAYVALLVAPKATLIDIATLVGTPPGGAAIGRQLSRSFKGLNNLRASWSIAFTGSNERKYRGLVVNNSWGMYHRSEDFPPEHPGRYADNPDHPFTKAVSHMATHEQADIVFAAGNCGADCPDARCRGETTANITGANASANVLSIAGCTLRRDRVGYSSQGPAAAGMGPNKPDLAAFTHFNGSQALGTDQPDKGTSAACPVVAGCLAALRTKISAQDQNPLALARTVRETATPPSREGGWNKDFGFGIINPLAAALALDAIAGA